MHSLARKLFTRQIRSFKWQRKFSVGVVVKKSEDFVIKSALSDIVIPEMSVLDRLWKDSAPFVDQVAIECAETKKRYTYKQLHSLTAAFATSLHRHLGLRSGDAVAVMLPNCPEFPVVALGILQAGCVLTTINPIYKELKPCKMEDSKCMTQSAQAALKYILSGIPELRIEPAEPLYMDFIESAENNLRYTYTDSEIHGFRDCQIDNVQLSLQSSKTKFDLYCKLSIEGKYELEGRLLILPVEGKGNFRIAGDKIHLAVEADLKQVQADDGRSHLTIKHFIVKADALEKVQFDFSNLFNGNQQLAEAVLKFANENYREVVKEVSTPFYNAIFKKLFKDVNRYLNTVPIEDLVIM